MLPVLISGLKAYHPDQYLGADKDIASDYPYDEKQNWGGEFNDFFHGISTALDFMMITQFEQVADGPSKEGALDQV
jgi:hypothetical protein